MKVDKITLHCSKCDPSDWIDMEPEDVRITLDLKTDQYLFLANCPYCGHTIQNSRRAF